MKTVAVANKWIEEVTVGQALSLSLPRSPEKGNLMVMDAVPDLAGTGGAKQWEVELLRS